MPFLTTPRLNFYYRLQGDVDGLPLLLLHGSYASGRWWEPLLAILPVDMQVLTPDLRGCGQSDKLATGYTMEEQCADVATLVDALNWRSFDLVAHASSGAIAIELALTRADLVRSLMLVDPVPVEGVFTPMETLMALEAMRADRALLQQALRLLMPTLDMATAENAAFFAQLVEDAAAMAPVAFTAIAESLNQWNRFADAKRLTLPTLLIWGDQDQIVSRDAMTRTLIAIPGATGLEILQGVGHSPMIEAPLTLAEKIVEFVAEDFGEYEQVRESVYSSG